jgi:hypothetical protein
MKKTMTQLGVFWALFHFFVMEGLSLFAQEGMPIAKDDSQNAENYAAASNALPLIQTFPGLPPFGRNGSFLGEEVSNLGDVNADGYDDWALGFKDAAIYPSGKKVGKVYICFGSNSLVNEKAPNLILTGEGDTDRFGISVAAAGDVNHDGFADVLVGAESYDAGGFDVGRAYLYFGGANMDNVADVIFTGEASSDLLGTSAAAAGDVNHDGFSDVIIGAAGNSAVGFQMGRAYVYAGSATTTGVEDKANETPGRYHLFQNYPNPFNPTTNVRFSLPQREHVTLKIFDLLGKEVATLIEADLDPGEHAVLFDGNGLSSGVYLCHFKAGAFVEQKRLVLLR